MNVAHEQVVLAFGMANASRLRFLLFRFTPGIQPRCSHFLSRREEQHGVERAVFTAKVRLQGRSASRQRGSGPSKPETPFNFENFIEEIPHTTDICARFHGKIHWKWSHPRLYLSPFHTRNMSSLPEKVYKSSSLRFVFAAAKLLSSSYKFYP